MVSYRWGASEKCRAYINVGVRRVYESTCEMWRAKSGVRALKLRSGVHTYVRAKCGVRKVACVHYRQVECENWRLRSADEKRRDAVLTTHPRRQPAAEGLRVPTSTSGCRDRNAIAPGLAPPGRRLCSCKRVSWGPGCSGVYAGGALFPRQWALSQCLPQ